MSSSRIGAAFLQFLDERTDEFLGSGVDIGAVKGVEAVLLQEIERLLHILKVERTVETVTERQLPASVQYSRDRISR